MSSTSEIINGIDRERLDAWLTEHVPEARSPFRYALIAGGRSNLTYEVADREGRRFVLRRPPLGHVLESAHDVAREHRIISALGLTAVPVPRARALCEDPAVNGAPFYVMDFVDGVVLRTRDDAEQALDEPGRAAAGRALVDVLADLHALDPDAVGLGTLGRRDSYAERQLRRWHRQFESSKRRDVPDLDEAHRRLSARVPPQRRTSIVHGDYRLDNCIIGSDGSVRAVLDWELSTLGDPLADLGMLMVYWVERDDDEAMITGSGTAASGFPDRAEVARRYAQRAGVDLADLEFFVALGYWKLACIFEGIRARYGAGVMGDDDMSAEQAAAQVERLAATALEHTDALR